LFKPSYISKILKIEEIPMNQTVDVTVVYTMDIQDFDDWAEEMRTNNNVTIRDLLEYGK